MLTYASRASIAEALLERGDPSWAEALLEEHELRAEFHVGRIHRAESREHSRKMLEWHRGQLEHWREMIRAASRGE
jgi:hypothetical protein